MKNYFHRGERTTDRNVRKVVPVGRADAWPMPGVSEVHFAA